MPTCRSFLDSSLALTSGTFLASGAQSKEWGDAKLMPPSTLKTWVLYVLRCADDSFYCGITNDLKRRIAQHNAGKGARYTRGRGPVVLIKSWPAAGMSAALKAERAFKALNRTEKEKKIRSRARKDVISLLLRGE
jgi:putative endonuclease